MKKMLLFGLLTLLSCRVGFSQHQQKLVVKAGKTVKISAKETTVNELIMDDNATIELVGLNSWTLHARTARIGKNCKIIGKDKNGKNGTGGKNGKHAGGDCQRGSNGRNGGHGKAGKAGIDIKIYMEILELGTLTIDTRGGKGGNGKKGGRGGNGGKADVSKNCRGGNGGTGGNGGNAGRGGDGGNIIFEYSFRGKTPLFNNSKSVNTIRTLMSGGKNGKIGGAGTGGNGGSSVSRRLCKFCPKITKGGGAGGSRGKSGTNPNPANLGKLTTNAVDRGDCLDDADTDNYAIVVAISESESGEGNNPVFVEDAKKLVTTLEQNYSFDEVIPYYNISRKELENDILKNLGIYGEDSNIFIYLSGHGINDANFPAFNTSDDYPMPFNAIYSYVEGAKVGRVLLILDACHSGRVFDNKHNSINAYTPHKSILWHPRETCGKKALTVISSGFDDETIPARDFIEELIHQLASNKNKTLTAETLFYRIKRQDFKAQKPVFGKSKTCESNQCIESDFIFFKQ